MSIYQNYEEKTVLRVVLFCVVGSFKKVLEQHQFVKQKNEGKQTYKNEDII